MTKIGDAKRKLHGMITGKPDNFSWLIEGKLAGSAIPTSKDEIKWLQEQGVKSVVTIREVPLDDDWVDEMKYLHVLSCLLYTSPSPRDATLSRMPSSA